MKIILFFLGLANITTSQVNKSINSKIKRNMFFNKKEILISQIESGAAEDYGSFNNYSEKDLNALCYYEIEILKNSGFKEINEKEFSKKIQSLFSRIIDYKSEKLYLKIDVTNICDKNLVFKPFGADYQNIYISKKEKFISYFFSIPYMVDYLKLYPELSEYEKRPKYVTTPDGNEEITRWKDVPNLKEIRKKNIQTLVARNMYLFNNSRAHFRWLIVNDEYFMRSLVTTFGYTEDAELLEWVVEKTNFNDQDELNKLFYNAKCDGRTQLNTAVFPALKKYITPKNKIVLEQLQKYLFKLIDLQNEFAGLHFKERTELIARLSYFGELYRFKPEFEYTNYDNNYFIFSIFTFDTSNRFKTEMKNKNYYGLPDFMKLYDKAEKEYSKYYYKSIGE